MGASVIDAPVRLRIALAEASDKVLSRWSSDDADGICIDADRYSPTECANWIERGLSLRLQIFVVGSRERLADWEVVQDVSLIEKDPRAC